MTSRQKIAGITIALLLAGGAAFWWWRPVPVTVTTLQWQTVQRTVVSTGRVVASRESTLGSTQTGRVLTTPVAEGASVKAGTVLLTLEPDEWLAARTQADAQLADANGQWQDAQRQWQRQQQLFAQGFISQAARDVSRRSADLAREKVRQLAALRQQADARLAQAVIRAPADGVLLSRMVEAGDVVTAGKTLLRFAAAGEQKVLLALDERDLGRLAVGQAAAVRADAYPAQSLPARVAKLAANVDADRGTVEVELALTAQPVWLRSGMTVSAEVMLGAAQRQLLLPASAWRDGKVARVREGRVAWVPVKAGEAVSGYIPVQSGVQAGDRIIVPAPVLDEGQRVEPQP